MSQRASGYKRMADEAYYTPDWVAAPIAHYLRICVEVIWEPAPGNFSLANALEARGFKVMATTSDFLKADLPPLADAIVTNPPYGEDRRSSLAIEFIRHALDLDIPIVAMLLRNDFDSGKTRTPLFRDCPRFAGKIVLLDRIKWFDGPSQPSDNHAWFIWHQGRCQPWIRYASRYHPEFDLPIFTASPARSGW